MNNELYQDIFKRRSFHLFRNLGSDLIEKAELEKIETAYLSFDRLYPEIRTLYLDNADDEYNKVAEYIIRVDEKERCFRNGCLTN